MHIQLVGAREDLEWVWERWNLKSSQVIGLQATYDASATMSQFVNTLLILQLMSASRNQWDRIKGQVT